MCRFSTYKYGFRIPELTPKLVQFVLRNHGANTDAVNPVPNHPCKLTVADKKLYCPSCTIR